jgi:hypothetical protein
MASAKLAITQFFTAFVALFTVIEKLANTADNLASVAEESSGAFRDQARIDRAQKLAALNHETAKQQKTLSLDA